MFQQPVHQFLPGIVRGFVFIGQSRVSRQQHFGLDMDQGGRHVHEFGPQIDIHFPRLIHVLQVLRSDGCDRDVLDIDLLSADQVQQQVQRPVILRQVEIERLRHYLTR